MAVQAVDSFIDGLTGYLRVASEILHGLPTQNFPEFFIAAAGGALVCGLFVHLRHRGSRAEQARRFASLAEGRDEAAKVVEEQYRTLFQGNPVPAFICEPRKWRILDANEAAAKEYGYAREELLKMSLPDLGPTQDAEKLADALVSPGLGAGPRCAVGPGADRRGRGCSPGRT